MRKPKFKVGQVVCGPADYCDKNKSCIGKVKKIRSLQETTGSGKKQKTSMVITYHVKLNNGYNRNFNESQLADSKSSFYSKQRNKEKASARRSVTRAKNTLEKNKKKLAELEEKLKSIDEGKGK